MMIPFLIYFISIGWPFWMNTMMTMSVSNGTGNGPARSGGTNSHTFAKDGGILYLGQHPTWVFTLSVHSARPSQTCWNIPHPFRSLLITLRNMTTFLQKMKRGYSFLSSNVIVSAASAFDCVLQYYRNSSRLSTRNIQF